VVASVWGMQGKDFINIKNKCWGRGYARCRSNPVHAHFSIQPPLFPYLAARAVAGREVATLAHEVL
jgi:hypothetical protein